MLKSELIEKLEADIEAHGDDRIGWSWLMEFAFAGTRALKEHRARAAIIMEIIRAKRAAGCRGKTIFFRDVWPPALEALLAKRARQGRLRVVVPIPPGGCGCSENGVPLMRGQCLLHQD